MFWKHFLSLQTCREGLRLRRGKKEGEGGARMGRRNKKRAGRLRDGGDDDQVMASAENQWKTGPASAMEGLESGGVAMAIKKKKGSHLIRRNKKRRQAKGTEKALAVAERITGKSKTRLSRKSLRQDAKQLW